MTFTAVGSAIPVAAGTFSLTPGNVGDFILAEVTNQGSAAVATALSSSNVTWAALGSSFSGVTNANSTAQVFLGTVTSTSTATVTITFSGGSASTIGGAAQEFSATAGAASVTLDVRGTLDSAGTATWASLTPGHGAGELYFGYAIDNTTASSGSTSGFTYVPNSDGHQNGMAYNANCANSAQAPVWGDSQQLFGIMVLVYEASAAGVTYVPQRYGRPGQPSPAPWEQRPYRSVPGAVDTPANPLPSPLDSAWQAGGRYWHLYGDSADAAPRTWQSLQRNYVSDPSLLSAADADPLALNPEQSPSSDLWRAAVIPAFCDRRQMPQQRAYYGAPITGLLENELLGGADTARHYGWFTDRREVPQQRPYVSDPALATAELENELLGGGDTGRYYLIAAYWDRREYPQQRLYESDPNLLIPPVPFDPATGGQDDLGRRQRQPATHYDRREVPQQRAYISDPSFYPTVAPADLLTVAWGAGGSYWHLYNRAADITDRREVPQQRAYVSPPGLLAIALLENELLGGADDLARHRAWYADRREVPSQPARTADPLLIGTALLEPPLLGSADDLRRHASIFTDRRLVPVLRPGTALPDIPADPLILGDDRARHLLAAGYWPRGWSWFQRLYFPLPVPPPPVTYGTARQGQLAIPAAVAGNAATAAARATAGQMTIPRAEGGQYP